REIRGRVLKTCESPPRSPKALHESAGDGVAADGKNNRDLRGNILDRCNDRGGNRVYQVDSFPFESLCCLFNTLQITLRIADFQDDVFPIFVSQLLEPLPQSVHYRTIRSALV